MLFMEKALYWRLAVPEGFYVAGLIDEVVLRLGTSSTTLLQPLELLWETRPHVTLLFLPRPSTNCQVREMNEQLLQALGSVVDVSINGFRATHTGCVVSVQLPSGVPCDFENPSMFLANQPGAPKLSRDCFDKDASARLVVQPPVQVRLVLELVSSVGPTTDRDRVKLLLGLWSHEEQLSVQADLQSWFQWMLATRLRTEKAFHHAIRCRRVFVFFMEFDYQ